MNPPEPQQAAGMEDSTIAVEDVLSATVPNDGEDGDYQQVDEQEGIDCHLQMGIDDAAEPAGNQDGNELSTLEQDSFVVSPQEGDSDNQAAAEAQDVDGSSTEGNLDGAPAEAPAQADDGLMMSATTLAQTPRGATGLGETEFEPDPAPRTGRWVVDARSGRLERYWVWDDTGEPAAGELVGPENGAGYYAWAMADGRILRGRWDSGAGYVYVADNDGRLLGSGMSSNDWVVTDLYDGHLERYWVDATRKAARSGFFAVEGYGDVFGLGGKGYVYRGDFQFGGRKWSSDNDGRLRSGWYVTSGFGQGTQRYWMGDAVYGSPHAAAASRLVGPSEGDASGYYAWAMADGRILRGKWDGGAGRVYVADNDGRLMGSDLSADGWVVTSAYDGSMQRYYVDAAKRAACSGFFTVPGYGALFGMGGQGYVFRGVGPWGGAVLLADNDGRLPSKRGWDVTDRYGQGLQRYWFEPIYSTYLGAVPGYSDVTENGGWAHYTLPTGYVLRNDAIIVSGEWCAADSDGKLIEVINGKYGYQNPSWLYQLSANSVVLPYPRSGIFSFAMKSAIAPGATRAECVEAFIATAYKYVGTPYIWDYACAPGVGVDCAGLVLQCLYSVGINPSRYTPYDHYYTPGHDHYANDMRNDTHFQSVSFAERQRGDLICYDGHIAIYLGNNRVIQAESPEAGVRVNSVHMLPVTGVRRVFI